EKVLEAWEDWKNDALKDVNSLEIHSQFDILSFSNEWNRKTTRMLNNLRRVPKRLEKEGIITSKQLSELLSRSNEIERLIKNTKKEIESDLKDINAKKLKKMKKSIQEKYKKQTSE
uniref:hypothetical protein n=1 Tax=Lentibacillus saliphilus TaxID=2737028 RepID=UPI001C2F83DB